MVSVIKAAKPGTPQFLCEVGMWTLAVTVSVCVGGMKCCSGHKDEAGGQPG